MCPREARDRGRPGQGADRSLMTEPRSNPIVACLAGDGIGPEVMAEAGRVIEAVSSLMGARVRQVHLPFGGDAIDKHQHPFPQPRAGRRARHPTPSSWERSAGPRWESAPRRPEAGLLELRKELDTFANLRPVRHEGIDLIVVRELTGGLYFGEKVLTDDSAFDTCSYSRGQIERVGAVGLPARQAPRRPRCLGGQGQRARDVQAVAPGRDRAPRRRGAGAGAHPRARRLVRDEPGDAAGPLRRDPDREPVRRHPERPGRGGGRRPGPRAVGVARRRRPGHLRARARLGARHRRPGRGQPDRDDPLGRR